MKKTKMIFFTVSFSRFAPSRPTALSGLPNANAKVQCFSYAISHIAPLHPVVVLSSTSQIAARYAAFWHASPQIALAFVL